MQASGYLFFMFFVWRWESDSSLNAAMAVSNELRAKVMSIPVDAFSIADPISVISGAFPDFLFLDLLDSYHRTIRIAPAVPHLPHQLTSWRCAAFSAKPGTELPLCFAYKIWESVVGTFLLTRVTGFPHEGHNAKE